MSRTFIKTECDSMFRQVETELNYARILSTVKLPDRYVRRTKYTSVTQYVVMVVIN